MYEVQPGSLEVLLVVTSRWNEVIEPEIAFVIDGGAIRTRVRLERQQPVEIRLHIEPSGAIDRSRSKRVEEWQRSAATAHTPVESPLIDIVNRSIEDLGSFALLEGPEEEWLTPAAGAPLYMALWGRDALTAAWQASLFDNGAMARSALATMARLQGTRVDDSRDEEPGRIIQQAGRNRRPYDRYYADFASPFDFIFALAHAYACSGDRGLVKRHYAAAMRVLEWAEKYGDSDRDGYLEYHTRAEGGPKHQGWKDSDNAVVGEDGAQVEPPLAACEVQGYWFAALQIMAVLSAVLGERALGLHLWREASRLKERFNRDFWMEDVGFVAFGLDREKRQIRALTSNAGQTLATGIISARHAPRVVERLFRPDLFSGWGIRTLSTSNPAYHPLDYHLGSVWLIENATIVFGLRRFGFDSEAVRLARALFDLALVWHGRRVPECVGGYSREELAHPGAYPRANAPQMWNQSAWALILQSLLGIQPLAPLGLVAVDPVLPSWLPEVTLRNLRIGDAKLAVRFRGSKYEVLERQGSVRVLHQPPPESLFTGIWERLLALVA